MTGLFETRNVMIKAIGLLSGGLDSTLAVKLMLNQGIEVIALNFVTPFCTCTRKGCPHEGKRVAKKFGIEIKVITLGDEYIEMVRNARYGYGKNMNPCIDCRILMLKKSKEYMEKMGASFIFTGEVLGQRPMSQRKSTMILIEKESGLEGLVLRPLSAGFLEPTVPETEELVNREKLLSVRGRRRKLQMKLAEEFGVEGYRCPAGGCRLTDPQFARKIRESLRHDECSLRDINLLKQGRHFRLPSGSKIIVGRNQEENLIIPRFAQEEDLLMEVVGFGSPLTMLKGNYTEEEVKIAASICARYSDCDSKSAKVRIGTKSNWKRNLLVKPLTDQYLEVFRIA